MRRIGAKLGRAIAIVGVLSGLAASPVLADHGHGRGSHYEGHGHHPGRGYYRGYQQRYYGPRYYYAPRPEYYAPPPLYLPPPPSWGLNLIFPLHVH